MDNSTLTLEDRARAYAALLCLEAAPHVEYLTADQCAALEKAGFCGGDDPVAMDYLQACPNRADVVRLAADLLPPHMDAPEKCWTCDGSGTDHEFERNPCPHCEGYGYVL